ncbi:MAG: FmdB family transcriptional regulator [Actinomycetota bacterium]|nr:FmdB family transcriptional regulator [Actinomycetota bacterium]
MPTYEYACGSCDAHHEIVQKMTDPTLTECPDCGQPTLRKLFNGVGVVFKGSGFYRTDSRSADKGSSDKGASTKGSSDKGSSTSDAAKSTTTSSDSSSSGSSSSSSSSSTTPTKSTAS